MRFVVSSTLVLLYSLFVFANLYSIVMGGLSVTRGIFLILSVLAIIALTGKGGDGLRFWTYILCGLLGFAGILLVGYSFWAYFANVPIDSTIVIWAGPILTIVAATTYWVVKTGGQPAPDHTAESQSR